MGRRLEHVNTNVKRWSHGDDSNKYFIEVDNENQQNTKARCKALKEIGQDPSKKKIVETIKQIENRTNQNHNQITLEMVQRKLESIGIIINVERLMRE